MVKDIKSRIQDTDRFIIQDIDDELKTVDGSDLAEFVEDLQSRFTDDVEQLVVDLNTSVQNNAASIGTNQALNETAHAELNADISKNKTLIAENRTKNIIQDQRLEVLERNSRVFGYYASGKQGIADNGYNPFALEEGGVGEVATGIQCPPGFILMLNDSDKVTEYWKDTVKIAFNKVDGFGNKAGFLGVYGSDVIEITTYVNDATNKIENRGTFRVLYEQTDIPAQSQQGDIIIINVAFINASYPDKTYKKANKPPGETSNYYNKLTNYPSQATDKLVTKENLPKALSPVGGIKMWPRSTEVPDGYMICDGTSVSTIQSRYPDEDFTELEAVVVDKKIPDLRGRTPIGTLHSWDGSINANANKSRYDVTEFKWVDQQTILKEEWFSTANAGAHNHNVNISSGGSHSHKVGDTSEGAGGNQVKAHSVILNNSNYTNTSTAPNHIHTADVLQNGEHTHEIKIVSDDKIGNEVRPAGWGVCFIIKIFHVDPFA